MSPRCAELQRLSRFGQAVHWTETRDLALMAEAARSGGVVTTSTLGTCGFSEPAIRAAMRRGFLTRWGRGVYTVGPVTDDLTEARAALHAAPHGTLGFDVAAQLAEFRPMAVPPLDLIVPPDRHGERKGVRIHRIELGRRDVTRVHGLPVTTGRHARPSRSEAHAAAVRASRSGGLRQAPHEPARAHRCAARGGRGTVRLKRMLEVGVDDLRSRAERALKQWIRAASLPSPVFNAQLGPWKVDALWPSYKLAVEVNGYAAHSSPWADDRDHRKEQYLLSVGYATRRFTALQAIDEPALVIAGIAAALAQNR